MQTPTREQLERFIHGAEKDVDREKDGTSEQPWVRWCAESLRSAWRQAAALDGIGQQLKDGLLGKRSSE